MTTSPGMVVPLRKVKGDRKSKPKTNLSISNNSRRSTKGENGTFKASTKIEHSRDSNHNSLGMHMHIIHIYIYIYRCVSVCVLLLNHWIKYFIDSLYNCFIIFNWLLIYIYMNCNLHICTYIILHCVTVHYIALHDIQTYTNCVCVCVSLEALNPQRKLWFQCFSAPSWESRHAKFHNYISYM